MRKKLLVFLISSLAMASTSGNFEITADTGNELFYYNKDYTDFNVEAKGELKILGSGFSVGGNIRYKVNGLSWMNNGRTITEIVKGGKEKTRFWAKYDFPKFYGVGTSLKATVDPLATVDLQGYIGAGIGNTFLYTTVIYSGKKFIKDPVLLAFLGTTYRGVRDLDLSIKLYGKYDSKVDTNYTKYAGSAELISKYTAITDIELLTSLKVEYKKTSIEKTFIDAKQIVSYIGINDLTITGTLENKIELSKDNNKIVFLKYLAKPEISAEYKYEVNEELTLTPKIKIGTELGYYKYNDGFIYKLYATPEILLTYKPVTGLTLQANAELPVENGIFITEGKIKVKKNSKNMGSCNEKCCMEILLEEETVAKRKKSNGEQTTLYYTNRLTQVNLKGKISAKYEW